MIRLEIFRAVGPLKYGIERAFIACLEFDSVNPETKKHSIAACMNFFGETEDIVRARAEQWLGQEREREARAHAKGVAASERMRAYHGAKRGETAL
jgi:hypothetical protein